MRSIAVRSAIAPFAFLFASALASNANAADSTKPAAKADSKIDSKADSPSPAKKKTASRAPTSESERALETGASKKKSGKGVATKKKEKPKPCFAPQVEIRRGLAGSEQDLFSITQCDGSLAPTALEHLSVLARPGSAAKPEKAWTDLAKTRTVNISPGVRRVDAGLAARLEEVVRHFTKDGKTPHLSVVSGYRPASVGSFHASGKALDFHVEGVSNEALVAFCKTLPDTGCGYYPNSSFVHMDVRPAGTGHVQWIDASGPGESPHYVSAWPPPPEPLGPNGQPLPATDDLPPLPVDEHPADPGSVSRPIEIPFDQATGPSDFEAKNGEADPAL